MTTGYQGPEAGRQVGQYVGVTLREVGELRVHGDAPVPAYLRSPRGAVRPGALHTLADTVGGMCAGLAALPDGWVVSTNLAVRGVARDHIGPFAMDASVLRRGRNNVVTGVQIRDAGAADALVLDGVLTSAILVPENGPPPWSRPLHVETGRVPPDRPVPIPEWLRLETRGPDEVEIPLADDLRNPWGILHGGVVAMLVDLAAEHAAGGGVLTDVVLHFVAPNRAGPVRAVARRIGGGETFRVEVRDEGAARVTAVAVASVTPA
jgi:acyl-coenzyme A thioesterase PaaI-like protein